MLEMNGLTNRFVNKFVSEIEKKDVQGLIVVSGIVYNLIIDLVPPKIQKVLETGIPKKDEEYGACIELGPQAVLRYFWETINQAKKDSKKGNYVKVEDNYLKKKGIDAHELKKDIIGKKAPIAHYDIYINKDTGELFIFEKAGKGVGIPTEEFLK